MNISTPSSQLRQHEPQDLAGFIPDSVVRGVTKKADALPVITVIVVFFVLLAVLIIVLVRYGPQLRILQITLQHEPMPQDLESGVHLTDWKKLGSKRKSSMQPAQNYQGELCSNAATAPTTQCCCKHQLPCGNAEPNVIEITYL